MLNRKSSWNFILYFNETLLYQACKSGDIEIVKHLISLNKFDIKYKAILINM